MKINLKSIALAGLLCTSMAFQPGIVHAAEKDTQPKENIFETIADSVLETRDYVDEVGEAKLDAMNAKGKKIAAAAKAQIGRYQDCTMLVTNSLKAVGINFHGWPHEYAQLGKWTNNPVPGDIVIYQGHVAIYVGDGKAVHGGWLGANTVLSTVACTNPLVGYIHVS